MSLRRVIPVKDVNDNPPVFHNRPYLINISEATPVGSEIEVSERYIFKFRGLRTSNQRRIFYCEFQPQKRYRGKRKQNQ